MQKKSNYLDAEFFYYVIEILMILNDLNLFTIENTLVDAGGKR